MVGHSPTNMHMAAYVTIANVAEHESIPRINLTWDQKVLDPYSLMKNLGTTIQKMTKSIGLILAKSNAPSKVMLFGKEH
jgi:hypothetical protein